MTIAAITRSQLHELFDSLEDHELTVTWQVTSAIGPGWIGSARRIEFHPLPTEAIVEDSPLLALLREALIARLAIPEQSADECIDGEGTLTIAGGALEFTYSVRVAAPYAIGRSEHGTLTLLDLTTS